MTSLPRVSVVLSTHNRRELLSHALRSLLSQSDAPPHEILIVDNRSTDGTRDLAASMIRDVPDGRLIYVYEPQQGLSHARNAGIALARAPVIAFTDDDVRVDAGWMASIERAFSRHPEAAYVGGRVLPLWDTPPPSWLTPAHWSPLALQDHGDDAFEVGPRRPLCLVGANMAFRAEVFRTTGRFSPHVQLTPGTMGTTEDHELMRRVWDRGGRGVYDPAIIVRTIVQQERRTRRYHRRWHYEHGRSHARMRLPEMERSRARLLGVPVHLFRQAAIDAMQRVAMLFGGDRSAALRLETRLCFFVGFVRERIATRGRPEAAPETPALLPPTAPGEPLVSIVIPCYNQASYLREAISSALSQSHRPIEVIVVDDGSRDDTAAVASRYEGVTCLRQPNGGLARARNAGLAASHGAHVVFLDADDRLHPAAVERGLRALVESHGTAMAFGRSRVIDAAGDPVFTAPESAVRVPDGDGYAALLRSNIVWTPAVAIFDRRALDDVGGFDPTVNASADYDVYLRVARRYRVAAHEDVVADYRHHGAAMSRNATMMLRTTSRVHRRQRRSARRTATHLSAYREGRRFWQAFFGDQVIDTVRAAIRRGDVREFAAGLLTMARFAPGRLAWHVGRWVRNSLFAPASAKAAASPPKP
jgi:glycosyltransferase involved in cell wall biosynthesis